MIDFNWLCQCTGLNAGQLISLQADYDNIIASLTDLKNPSFEMYVLHHMLKHGKHFPSTDRYYIANAVCENIKPWEREHYLYLQMKQDLRLARYYLILSSVFHDFLCFKMNRNGAPKPAFYLNVAKDIFYENGHESIAESIDEWVSIIQKLKIV